MTYSPAPDSVFTLLSESQLSPDILRAILLAKEWRLHRVLRIDTPQGEIIVKGQRPARGPSRYKILNLIAGTLRTPFLKAAPAWGGARAQQIEVSRLRTLAALGFPVPAVLHVDDEFFVMSSLGEDNLAHIILSQPEIAYEAWQRGGALLMDIHKQGQYLSQAFARNFVLHDGKLGLIDFEDDPLEVMSLAEAQVRDWLAYLHSTVWLLAAHHESMPSQVGNWLSQESDEVQKLMQQAANRLSWMRRLSSNRRRWGRDTVSIQAVGALLHRWSSQRPKQT